MHLGVDFRSLGVEYSPVGIKFWLLGLSLDLSEDMFILWRAISELLESIFGPTLLDFGL